MRNGRWARGAVVGGRRKSRVVALLLLGSVNLGVLGTDVFLLSQRNVTRPVSLGTALQRFRAAQAAHAGDVTPSTAVPSPAVTHAATTSGPAAAPTVPTTNRTSTVSRVAAAAPAAAAAAASPFALPPEGVYSYATTGGEQVNILDASHSYPSTTYATVRHLSGCQWTIENDVIQEHTDKRQVCSEPAQFLQIMQSRQITFFGKTDGGSYTCSPLLDMITAGEPAGTVHSSMCGDSSGNAAQLRATDMGAQTFTVGATPVTVVRVVVDGTLTGRAVGTSHDDLLLLATTGMTVRWIRSVDTVANAAFGARAHYVEHASFTLTSLVPQT